MDNRPSLRFVYLTLKRSLVGVLMNKHKTGVRDILKKYGPDVTLNITRKDGSMVSLSFGCPSLRSTPWRFLGTFDFRGDPLSIVDWKISTLDPMGQCCSNCGTDERIEMHHLKHIKTINPKLKAFDRSLARINRKQVPLCRPCHNKVHKGVALWMSIRNHYFIPFSGSPKWS